MATADTGASLRATLRHGAVCYLQIPVLDLSRSAAFYERVFGWQIDLAHPSFEAPGLIGQFVDDRAPASESGLLAWISVDRIDEALLAVSESGGEVVEPPTDDGPERLLATVQDPAGNRVGLVEHRAPGHSAAQPR